MTMLRGLRTTPTGVGVAGLSAVAVTYGFARYGYGLLLPAVRDELGLSTRTLGFVASAGYAAYLLAVVAAGWLSARTDPRTPVLLGGASATVGMTLLALSNSAAAFAAGAMLAGSSAGWTWAPFSDITARTVAPANRPRVLSAVSTGTTFGLITAAPVALVAGSAWRAVWATFALLALAATVATLVLVPPTRPAVASTGAWAGVRGPAREGARPLFAFAFAFTLAGAVVFTYAVDLVRAAGQPPASGPLVWASVGVGGLAGLATGDVVGRVGLAHTRRLVVGVLAAAVLALTSVPGSLPVTLGAALLYGAGYMGAAALLVVWAADVFDHPTAGVTVALLVASTGAVVGPAAAGLLAEHLGLAAAVALTAALPPAAIVVLPHRLRQDRKSRTRMPTRHTSLAEALAIGLGCDRPRQPTGRPPARAIRSAASGQGR